jgi:hypothetical protein
VRCIPTVTDAESVTDSLAGVVWLSIANSGANCFTDSVAGTDDVAVTVSWRLGYASSYSYDFCYCFTNDHGHRNPFTVANAFACITFPVGNIISSAFTDSDGHSCRRVFAAEL